MQKKAIDADSPSSFALSSSRQALRPGARARRLVCAPSLEDFVLLTKRELARAGLRDDAEAYRARHTRRMSYEDLAGHAAQTSLVLVQGPALGPTFAKDAGRRTLQLCGAALGVGADAPVARRGEGVAQAAVGAHRVAALLLIRRGQMWRHQQRAK